MYCRCHKYTFPLFRWKLKNSVADMCSSCLVKKHILAFPCHYVNLLIAYHIVYYISINASRIYNRPGLNCIIIFSICNRTYPKEIFSLLYLLYFCVEKELNAIHIRILCQRNCQMKRTDNRTCWCVQSFHDIICQVFLHLIEFIPSKNLKSRNTICLSFFKKLLKFRSRLFLRPYNERAIPLKRKIKFFRKLIHHFISSYIKPGLQRSWCRIKTSMNNCTVRFRCACTYIIISFNHTCFNIVLR